MLFHRPTNQAGKCVPLRFHPWLALCRGSTIDEILFRDLSDTETLNPGRMSILTAINFTIIGLTLVEIFMRDILENFKRHASDVDRLIDLAPEKRIS